MTSKDIYVLYSKPLTIGQEICCDFVFVDECSSNIGNCVSVLRLRNIAVEFLCAVPPGMATETFYKKSTLIARNFDCETCVTKMKDSQMFAFDHKFDYVVFSSTNQWNLRNCYNELKTFLIMYYTTLRNSDVELQGFDKIFYSQTESPFRFTNNTLNLSSLGYYLSTKYDIPSVGSLRLDSSKIKKAESIYPLGECDNIKNVYELQFSDIDSVTVCKEGEKYLKNVKVLAYDIETYNLGKAELIPSDPEQPIIAIGFSVFNISNPRPIRRYCIISKKFSEKDIADYEKIDLKTPVAHTLYRTKSKGDSIVYLVVKNEIDMLLLFVHYVDHIRPYTITGFNNWTFDDKWIHTKMELYGIQNLMINAINFYSQGNQSYMQYPRYRVISPKMDGERMMKSNYATWTGGFSSFHDAMFAALKEDPKRFADRSRKSLVSMLDIYNIVSPYDGSRLSKTGLSIHNMFMYWKTNTNIHEIAKYCCQDAWITGTFAIKRNMLGDLVEMSNITYTTFQDSLLRAVGIRVSNTISWYAYHENFALFDSPDQDSRSYRLKSSLGNKYYDRRTLIGGSVKNKRNGREKFIVALDFSSMYPSQKEGSNVDTSSRVDRYIIEHPEEFGLKLIHKYHLEDMYTNRWFYTFENSNGVLFNVEQLYAEYKLDLKSINEIKEKYNNQNTSQEVKRVLLDRFRDEIQPYHTQNNLAVEDLIENNEKLPNTIKVPVYFCQSPKHPDSNLPVLHYSMKEKMLSDFRKKRMDVKDAMKVTNIQVEKIQLSAKEKAIKVVMNSEYGQTGSDLFAHYDSDIGAAVTYASRQCIQVLTSCLDSEHFYVDETYLSNPHVKKLVEANIAKIEFIEYKPTWKLTREGSQRSESEWESIKELSFKDDVFVSGSEFYSENDWLLPPRRLTMSLLYDKLKIGLLNSEIPKMYRITLPRSELVYQDTDSNYYTNETIVNMYPVLNPTTINDLMRTLVTLNSLMESLIPDIIRRKPIGVGYEGAFIVVRYLNKKKKYFGRTWNPKMTDYLDIPRNLKDLDPNDYEKEFIESNPDLIKSGVIKIRYHWKNLPDDYEEFLTQNSGDVFGNYNTYYSTIPFKDGSYVKVDLDVIGDQDHLDYVNKNGIKCTGVDLARRDQFKFINFNHLLVFNNDLRWTNDQGLEVPNDLSVKFRLTEVIETQLSNFVSKLNNFPLEFYAKNKAYKEAKKTEVRCIVRRLQDMIDSSDPICVNNRDKLINIKPKESERINYLLIDELNTLGLEISGLKVSDKSYMIEHLRTLYSDEDLFEALDYRYYFEKLADALCNYIAIEEDPSIGDYLTEEFAAQNPTMSSKEIEESMKKRLDKVRNNLARKYLSQYYPKQDMKMIRSQITKTDIKENNWNKGLDEKYVEDMIDLEQQAIKLGVPSKYTHLNSETVVPGKELNTKIRYQLENTHNCDSIRIHKNSIEILMKKEEEAVRRGDKEIINKEYYSVLEKLSSIYQYLITYVTKNTPGYTRSYIHVKIWLDEINDKNIYICKIELGSKETNMGVKQESVIFNSKIDSAIIGNKDELKRYLINTTGDKYSMAVFRSTENDYLPTIKRLLVSLNMLI